MPISMNQYRSMEKLEKEFNVTISAVDCDAHTDLKKIYKITSVPTLIFLDAKSKEIDRVEGYAMLSAFRAKFRDILKMNHEG